MSALHMNQALKGNLLTALQRLEGVADCIRSAQKIVEATPSASTNNASAPCPLNDIHGDLAAKGAFFCESCGVRLRSQRT